MNGGGEMKWIGCRPFTATDICHSCPGFRPENGEMMSCRNSVGLLDGWKKDEGFSTTNPTISHQMPRPGLRWAFHSGVRWTSEGRPPPKRTLDQMVQKLWASFIVISSWTIRNDLHKRPSGRNPWLIHFIGIALAVSQNVTASWPIVRKYWGGNSFN